MDIEIFRVDRNNASSLDVVDPEIFDEDIDPDRLAAFVRSENHLMVVARAQGVVVGQIRAILHMQPDGPNELYIDNLGVATTHQRRGIAGQLLQEAFHWGKLHGCKEAWVVTEPDNDAARGLYRKFMTEPEQAVAYFQLGLASL